MEGNVISMLISPLGNLIPKPAMGVKRIFLNFIPGEKQIVVSLSKGKNAEKIAKDLNLSKP
ncbi:hypothetical protein G3I01_03975 [Gramella sp. MT6]|uniref:hypothetical protein n=1 Tax=Gramella sp. MT6 TaxID=2705471 RepID=UPI001C5E9452|nr:hypothetical protein [Gramella sp. MT6]QYA24698.1 hypothetical protein G3I01_03975 [Gramella sp. MT6]